MTIAVAIKVNDGIVIATDSASTLQAQDGVILTVHNNANKIVNICKGLPVGVMMWGLGNIGRSSITTLLKDVRRRFAGNDGIDWTIDTASYQLVDIAAKIQAFISEKYELVFPDPVPVIQQPMLVFPQASAGWLARGDPDLVYRIMSGVSLRVSDVFKQWGIPEAEHLQKFQEMQQILGASLIFDPMPIKDVIDIADWLVQSSIMFSRYTPGAATIGGPVEIAAITKHEGFKWVKRKHYFEVGLNQPRGGLYEDGWIKPNGIGQ